MTAQTTDVYSGNLRPDNSDEIDVRRYLLVLVKWWREILVISILTGAIAGVTLTALNNNKTPVYAANADILIARLMSNIELDERVSTSVGSGVSDANGWRASLLQLAKSSVVANAVLAELKGELPASLQTADALVGVIAASVPLSPDERYASNLIRITATTSVPDASAKIANSWARHLVDHINAVYGEVPATTIESVTIERDQALLAYQAAEEEYKDFVANNQIAVLSRQIEEKSTLRSELMLNYTRMVTAVISNEYNARIAYYTTLVTTPLEHATALVEAQSAGNVESLTLLYNLRASAVAQLSHAQNMERSLVDGGEAAAKSNAAALQLLKLAAFATLRGDENIPQGLTLNSQTQEIEMTLEEQLVDVRALATVLEEYVAQVEAEIAQVAESNMVGADLAAVGGLENPVDAATESGSGAPNALLAEAFDQLLASGSLLNQLPANGDSTVSDAHEELLSTLEAEIRTLQAAISAERAKERQLTHQRDLAWTTYDAVGNKLQELTLLRSSANTEVRVGNPALVPRSPQPQASPVMTIVALTLLGFLVAIVLALLVESLGGAPFFARRTA